MTKVTMSQGALTKQNDKELGKTQPERMSDFLAKPQTQNWIMNALGDKKEAQKFVSSILSATSTNIELQSCERNSVVSAALLANALGLSLSPQLGFCYIVPFKSKAKYDRDGNKIKDETITATFVLSYRGYIQLAIRSGYYKKINVIAIKEGELVSYDPLTEDLSINIIADDEIREKTPTVGYYAFFRLQNGFEKSIYWSKKKMMAHADKYSPAFSAQAMKKIEEGKMPEKDMWKYSSFWYKSFDEMAMKTLIRQLIGKWGIMSIDMQTAMESDVDAETEYLKGAANFNMAMPVEIVQDEEPTPEELAEAAADIQADADGVVLEGVPAEDKPKRGRPVREEAPQEA